MMATVNAVIGRDSDRQGHDQQGEGPHQEPQDDVGEGPPSVHEAVGYCTHARIQSAVGDGGGRVDRLPGVGGAGFASFLHVMWSDRQIRRGRDPFLFG